MLGIFYLLQDETEKAVKLTSRERRFIKFSSVEFDGQLYMTPQDFLDSVVEQEARRKLLTSLRNVSNKLISIGYSYSTAQTTTTHHRWYK